jgi:hypothetical protein
MNRAAFGYRITLAQVGLGQDLDLRNASKAVRAEVLSWLVHFGLEEKDRDLSQGLDKDGNPLAPIKPLTRKYRRSAMGIADPDAPPLMPAWAVSRTRLLLTGQSVDEGGGYAEFYWKYDDHTGGPWGQILDYQRRGVGRSKTKRDVIGASADMIARIRVKMLARWTAYKAHGFSLPPKAAALAVPVSRIVPVGRTDVEHFTFGIGGSGSESTAKAIAAGFSTGFVQPRTPGFSGFKGLHQPKPKPKPKPPGAGPKARPTPSPSANPILHATAYAKQAGVRAIEVGPAELAKFGISASRADGMPACFVSSKGAEAILINRDHPYWTDPAAWMAKQTLKRWLSDDATDHVIVHEVGHFLHRKRLGPTEYSASKHWTLTSDEVDLIKRDVSRYAATDPVEFIAEAYAAMKRGKIYSRDVMKLYAKYKGPKP